MPPWTLSFAQRMMHVTPFATRDHRGRRLARCSSWIDTTTCFLRWELTHGSSNATPNVLGISAQRIHVEMRVTRRRSGLFMAEKPADYRQPKAARCTK
jgi:hypothetical protein